MREAWTNDRPDWLSSPATSPALLDLIEQGRAFVAAMLPSERELYFANQRRQSVVAEIEARCQGSSNTI